MALVYIADDELNIRKLIAFGLKGRSLEDRRPKGLSSPIWFAAVPAKSGKSSPELRGAKRQIGSARYFA